MVVNDGMQYGSYIPIEWAMALKSMAWTRITDYVKKYQDNMTMRNVLAEKTTIDPTADIDIVLRYNVDVSETAEILAKGAVGEAMDHEGKADQYNVIQIGKGFWINERDLAKDPALQGTNVDIITRMIHRLEDKLAILGAAATGPDGAAMAGAAGLSGIYQAAELNATLGVANGYFGGVVASGASLSTLGTVNNNGAWDGSETDGSRDIYQDMLEATSRVDPDFGFKPEYFLCNIRTRAQLFALDSERQPFADQICGLFGRNRGDYSWIWATNLLANGIGYVVPKDMLAGEYAIQKALQINTDYPIQPGRKWWIDMTEWIVPAEIHRPQGFVKVVTT